MINKYLSISKISKIRGQITEYIACELRKRGIEGLVVSHGTILDLLYENNGKLTMKEISDGIHRSKSTVTQLIDKLLKANYVAKETDLADKRYSYIVLTDKGLSIKNDFREISDTVISEFYKDFTDEEIELFSLLLDRVIQNFTH